MLNIYNEKEFCNRIHSAKGVILFGAGKRLEDVEHFFKSTEIPLKVLGIVDNDLNKQGNTINLWEKEYEVFGLRWIETNSCENEIILITLEDYGSLLDELLAKESFMDIEIVCFSHIVALQKEAKSIHKVPIGHMRLEKNQIIPKKIHYCWFGGNPLPDKYKCFMESWYKYCPDYKIIEWNESNYDVSKCKYMMEAYERRMFGFVSDYARMDIIYNNGGIYLDTDVELVKNIDDLLYQKGFAGFEDENYVNLGSGFGTVKKLPILKAMIEHYNDKHFIDKNGELDLTPIPIHNNAVLSQYGLINNGEYQRVADMTIYPAKVLSGKCMYTMRTLVKPWTYAIHHYDGSWATGRARRINERLEQDMKFYHADQCDEE